MRILIADDHQSRYERLIRFFAEIGIPRHSVDFVVCSDQAEEKLNTTFYDLLILDLLLPRWASAQAIDTNHSIGLLQEILNGHDINKPGHIIGITSDKEVADGAGNIFEASTWRIIQYSAESDDWAKTISNSAAYILKVKKSADTKTREQIDLAIVCALSLPELRAVLDIPWNWQAAEPITDQIFGHRGFFRQGSKTYSVVAASTNTMGMVSTALLSQTLISQFSPRAIAMTGICAGVEGKVKGGDILFADPVWDYQSGKLVAAPGGGTMLKIDPTQHQADPVVKSNVENLFNEELMIQIYKDYKGDKSQLQVPNLLVGPVASGSMVLSDGQTMKKIQDQHRKLIGVEMEVFGLYAAAHCAPNPRPAVFALKSVCDFGDPEKNDIYQQYASYTSAKTLQILMESKASAIIS